jgi:hypothetical protein
LRQELLQDMKSVFAEILTQHGLSAVGHSGGNGAKDGCAYDRLRQGPSDANPIVSGLPAASAAAVGQTRAQSKGSSHKQAWQVSPVNPPNFQISRHGRFQKMMTKCYSCSIR